MTETTPPEACHICGEAKPLHQDPDGGGMLCNECQQLLDMGPEWINNAIRYLGEYEERTTPGPPDPHDHGPDLEERRLY